MYNSLYELLFDEGELARMCTKHNSHKEKEDNMVLKTKISNEYMII